MPGALSSYFHEQVNPRNRPSRLIGDSNGNAALGHLLEDFLEYYDTTFSSAIHCIPATAKGQHRTKQSQKWVSPLRPDGLAIQCLVNPGGCPLLTRNFERLIPSPKITTLVPLFIAGKRFEQPLEGLDNPFNVVALSQTYSARSSVNHKRSVAVK